MALLVALGFAFTRLHRRATACCSAPLAIALATQACRSSAPAAGDCATPNLTAYDGAVSASTRYRPRRAGLRVARVELAAALRAAALYGFNEGIDNHFSLVVPGRNDCFLLNPYGPHWSEMRASDLLTIGLGGERLAGEGELDTTAFTIHLGAHRARPDAACVLHTHMPYATALAMTEGGFDTRASQNAMYFHGRIARLAYGGLAEAEEEGRASPPRSPTGSR